MNAQQMIECECDLVKKLLLQKNKEYGNSAIIPLRIFSKAENTEQIKIRIDDKLSRLSVEGVQSIPEDTVLDLIGYLILLRVAEKYNTGMPANPPTIQFYVPRRGTINDQSMELV